MKKIINAILVVLVSFSLNSCDLDTEPTGKVSNTLMFQTAEAAETALNGIYRSTYNTGWTSSSWPAENFGITSVNMIADLMGEDFVMMSQGSGWFYEDYRFNVSSDYTNTSGRPYALWKFYYTLISNTNYIISSEETMGGDADLKNSVVGQAYAMRAYSYFMLAQLYQQTYVGNENLPGVPIYIEPTTNTTEGKPRGTLKETYEQINSDIDKSIELLKLANDANYTQKHKSNIDYYIAQGFKARIALVQNKFQDAIDASTIALTQPGRSIAKVSSTLGFNSIKNTNTMWGFEIIADQSTQYSSFFSHMDADGGLYAANAPKGISKNLYDKIPESDARQAWWRGSLPADTIQQGSSLQNYCQVKFKFADKTTRTGDYIVMRVEEMLLIKAEAECHLDKFSDARTTIKQLGDLHDTKYTAKLAALTDSKSYNQNTNGAITTLMDEILFQRRIELWGENGRIFDLQRLKLGFDRNYANSNHPIKPDPVKVTGVASKSFIMMLPQKEFDGNKNISPSEQNPMP